ncbi:replication initiation protein, partial [Staphylococcus succinus]
MTNEEIQKFTKLHKFLFTDETFKPMKAKSKLLYALITERQSLSARDVKTKKEQSQFLDKENRLFSIYSNDELSEMLHVSKPTIINLKKELVHKGLLEEIRVPNANNRLYPKKPYDEYFYTNDLDEFYRLPHALFSNPYYKKLSPDAIITYAIYLSRYEYSVFKDNFYDKNQRLYFIYPNDVLGDYLNFDRNKIARIKKQLIDYNLLEVKTSNRADMLYIKTPKACYDMEIKKCSIGKLKNAASGNQKMQHREIKKCSTSYTDFSNTNISNIDSS